MTVPDLQHADRVIDGLYIGSSLATREIDLLKLARVRRVLKLYYDKPHWPREFRVLDNPVDDGVRVRKTDLIVGTAFIHEGMAMGQPVLVACRMGISRSSTFVLAFLLERGYDLRAAWDMLLACHPRAWPAVALWRSLLDHYETGYTMSDVLRWLQAHVEPDEQWE